MPVFVAAVRRRTRRQGVQFPAALQEREGAELWQPTEEASPTKQTTKGEGHWIRRNLKAFYTEFESEREKTILKHTPPVSRRIRSTSSSSQDSVTTPYSSSAMDQDRMSPLSPGLQQGNPILIPNGVEKSFKSRRSFSSRQRDVEDILQKHPHKIPIIVERSKNEKHLGTLDKSKFLVPEELSMSQLTTIIRRRLQLTDTQAFYLMVNRRSMASAASTLSEVYRAEKDSDGFLYITYASQEMFG